MGAAGAPGHRTHGRLGPGKKDADPGREDRSRTISFWLAARRKRRAGNLSSDMDALPNGELEPGGQTLLPGAAAKFRCSPHLWTLRFAGTRRGRGVPREGAGVRYRADRDVRSDCPEPLAETDGSSDFWAAVAARSKRRDRHFGSGERRTFDGRGSPREDRIAPGRC